MAVSGIRLCITYNMTRQFCLFLKENRPAVRECSAQLVKLLESGRGMFSCHTQYFSRRSTLVPVGSDPLFSIWLVQHMA